jgi:hypothetical protein
MGGYLGVIVPIGFVYVIWKLSVSFPNVLTESYLKGHLTQHGFSS